LSLRTYDASVAVGVADGRVFLVTDSEAQCSQTFFLILNMATTTKNRKPNKLSCDISCCCFYSTPLNHCLSLKISRGNFPL